MSRNATDADQKARFYATLKDLGALHDAFTEADDLFGEAYVKFQGAESFHAMFLATRMHAALRRFREREAELIALADRRVMLARAEAHERVTELLASLRGTK